MSPSERIPSITSLRFFAAAAIFTLHFAQVPGFPSFDTSGVTLNRGVSFFYVLSGFVLHWAYGRRNMAWLPFLTLRVARIWPLHLAALFLAFALLWDDLTSWVAAYLSPLDLLSIVTLFHAWSPDNRVYFAINGVSWSLSVELFFYICFPLLHWLTIRSAATMFGIVLGSTVAYMAITWQFEMAQEVPSAFYSVNPLFRLPEFALGIVAAEVAVRLRTPLSPAIAAAVQLAALGAIVGLEVFSTTVVAAAGSLLGVPGARFAYNVACAPGFALLLIAMVAGGSPLTTALSWRPLVFLGEVSFAIYLTHQPLMHWLGRNPMFCGFPAGTLLAAAVVLTLALSVVAHFFIEMPVYREVRRRLERKWIGSAPNIRGRLLD